LRDVPSEVVRRRNSQAINLSFERSSPDKQNEECYDEKREQHHSRQAANSGALFT
jgi:hypothetical protein